MKKSYIVLIFIALLGITFSGCKKDEKKTKKIGLISGLGGFYDNNFNQSALEGFNRAKEDYNFIAQTKESFTLSDLYANIDYFAQNNFDLVIAMGYNFGLPVQTSSTTYPFMDFMIIDYLYSTIPSNVLCATFAVDQVSFPAGVLAAYWAMKKDPTSPVAGFVAGPDTTLMNQFAYSYIHGIEYFNTKYNKHVDYAGTYAYTYSDTVHGAQIADNMINNNGVDVIYAFAGQTGNGALSKAKELNKWGIGVDVDQYYSLPAVKDILLTSCMKRIDNSVYDVIAKYVNGEFAGGSGVNYTLSDNGVELAPYHDYNTQIPDSIKTLINKVKADIQSGTLSTGWK